MRNPRLKINRLLAAVALVALASGCDRGIQPNAPPGPAPIQVRLDHLRHLTRDAVVAGVPVRVVALYAEAPDYRPVASPARDGSEGIASVDDAARAAVVYLRDFQFSGDRASLADALGLLRFVALMEQGDGEYFNFIRADGEPNRTAASSRKSFSYWAARALWGFGEAVAIVGPKDPAAVAFLRAPLDRTVARLAREIDGGRLVAGSVTATAEALLGLLAYQRAEPAPARAAHAARTATLLAQSSHGDANHPPWGAFADEAEDWHAWGSRAPQALAEAARLLRNPQFADAARREADGLWARFLMAGQYPARVSIDGDVTFYPQIAYGIAPIVEGYLALAQATGAHQYAIAGGLTASWFVGANAARAPMYDETTGRTFDGLDGPSADRINRNAGGESTIEALLALQRIARTPDAADYIRYRPVGAISASVADVPARREFVGPSGERVAISLRAGRLRAEERPGGSAPIELTYWPAANPVEVRLATSLVSRWNAEHPDVQVRVQPLPASRSAEEVLLAAIAARATPDLCSNVSSALIARLIRAGSVLRLDRMASTAARLAERVTAPMIDGMTWTDQGVYALAWKANPMMLMYNVDLLAAAGIAPPRTHSDLMNAFRRLARDTDNDGRLDRWALWTPLKTTWYERFYDFYPLYLANSGGRTLVSGADVTFDNDAAVATLDVLRRGFAAGLIPRANFTGRDPFVDGVVAMKIIGPWFIRELEELKQPGLRYDVTPIPVMDARDASAAYAFADLKSIVIFSTTRHPEAAARFAAYLTSPEADRLLIEEASQLPYRRELTSNPALVAALARWPTLSTYAQHVERSRGIDLDLDIVEIFDILSDAYEAGAIYGTRSSADAIRRAAVEARTVLAARRAH